MKSCFFFRLLSHEDKGAALAAAVAAVRNGGTVAGVVHAVDPASFRQVSGSPFAYWVSDRIRRLFAELPPFEGEGRTVKQGLATADDFRFVRAWWEVPPERVVTGTAKTTPEEFRQMTFEGKRWVPFAKGGSYSPYYTDLHLVVNWERGGEEVRKFVRAFVRNEDFYFRPGLTWPLRGIRLSVQAVPSGAIFSVAGKLATSEHAPDLPLLLGIMNTKPFDHLVGLFAGKVGGVQYEVGLIGRIPLPKDLAKSRMGENATRAHSVQARTSRYDERSHCFVLPALVTVRGKDIAERVGACTAKSAEVEREASEYLERADQTALHLYGFDDQDQRDMETTISSLWSGRSEADEEVDSSDEEEANGESPPDLRSLAVDQLSYTVGCAFGRWDLGLAMEQRAAPDLVGPFVTLPVCSPGMLTGADGLPARETPPGYPLRISWDGILVDDSGFENGSPHQSDIVCRAQEVLAFLWGNRAEAIEQEACEILGVKSLRDYFRKPGGLFADHLKQYSKSRRQAPIYWPVSTASGSYTLWIYYHRLNEDLLYKAVNEYVNPKISETDRRIAQLEGDLGSASGRQASALRGKLEEAKGLRGELEDFKAELLRVAGLPYKPDLNDGVLITASPLWKLFRFPKWRKDLEACWKKLEAGEYDWAHLAYAIWSDRVKEVCIRDRSIAMAHDLEELYKGDAPTSAEKPRRARKT